MTYKSKLPPIEGSPGKSQPFAEGTSENRHIKDNSTGKVGKLKRMLSVFASGMRLNTFQAKELGDTCLHTTVSDLQARHNITFARQWEKIRNRFGTETRVLRYWLEGVNLERAQAIISGGALP